MDCEGIGQFVTVCLWRKDCRPGRSGGSFFNTPPALSVRCIFYARKVVGPLRLTVRTPDFQSDNESPTLSGGTANGEDGENSHSYHFINPYLWDF